MNPFNFFKYYPHLLRKQFNEKYIIIESDDWGLERALSKESIYWMEKKYGKEKLSRWSYDSLETSEDLNDLFGLLENYKSKFECPPVITSNFITHNINYSKKDAPKFDSLSNGFNPMSEDVRGMYKEGIKNNYIFPQLHGYSHYNLKEVFNYFLTKEGQDSLENNFFFAKTTVKGSLNFLHGEFSCSNTDSNRFKEAAEEFKNFFGFYSSTLIPPTFIFDFEYINILKDNKIKLIQSSNRLLTSAKSRIRFPNFHKRKGLYWSIRNARLDPHPEYKFYYEQCIDSIGKAFINKTPAVIDFHRVNFAGKYAVEYKQRTLKELKSLFDTIYHRWSDVKFIHTQQLSEILLNSKN